MRVRPAPEERRYEAWIAEDFEAGAEIVRALAQGPGLPDVIRVSDEEETEVSLALSGPRGAAATLFDGYLGAAPAPRRLPDRRRPRGRGGGGGAAPGAQRPRAARRRRRLPRPGRRALLGARALPGPLPARHADGHGGDGRDARDLPHLVPPRKSCARPSAPRSATRSPPRARRGSSSATSRTPTPTAPRSTSPSSPAPCAGEEIEQWRPVKRAACEAIVATRRHDHPPPRRRPRPRPLHGGRGGGDGARRPCGRSRRGSTRPGS